MPIRALLLISALIAFSTVQSIAQDNYPPGPDSLPQANVPKGEMLKGTYTAKESSVFSGAVQAEVAEWDISKYPEMAPERCAELPPNELYEKLSGGKSNLPGIGSERGHDYFCEVYQSQLQKFTDAHYPRAKAYRKEILAAVTSLTHFLEEALQFNGIKHMFERTGAEAEWMIYQAEKNNYQIDGEWAEGSPIELVEYALSFAKKAGASHDEEFERAGFNHLNETINNLVKAVEGIPRRYYSQALMGFLKHYEKKEWSKH